MNCLNSKLEYFENNNRKLRTELTLSENLL